MEDFFEEYGSLVVCAIAALIVGTLIFFIFKDGSTLSEWIHNYAKSLGG